jgi:hypothetical protein
VWGVFLFLSHTIIEKSSRVVSSVQDWIHFLSAVKLLRILELAFPSSFYVDTNPTTNLLT